MDFPLVDSHVHLWDPQRFSLPWLADLPQLNRPYNLEQYTNATQSLPVSGMVYVEVGVAPAEALSEAHEIAQLARHEPRIQAIVAAAPLEQGSAIRGYLETLVALGPCIKGVRRNLQDEALDFCLQPAFLQGVRLLCEYKLSFDLCIKHQHLPAVTELVRQCPEVTFILDHIGKPAIKQGQIDPWSTHLKQLATLPNISCKISGLVTEADHRQWKAADLAPYIQTVLEAFGEDRVMFGGDWPVLLLASSYQRWYETLHRSISDLSPVAQRKFWGENARRIYISR